MSEVKTAHLVLIDAMNLIRRIHAVQLRPFANVGELSDSSKNQIIHNTEQNCVRALKNILQELEPSHALAVFDSDKPCWRYQLYPDYKKGRSKMPEHLANNLERIQDSFYQEQVDSLVPDEDEADDIIATLAVKVALREQKVTIVSTDKSFLSLLSSNIRVYDYFNRHYLDEDYVKEKFSVDSQQLIDFWTLTGDSTNKIPGVAGIGAITAAQLLNEHQSLAAILTTAKLRQSQKQKLIDHQEQILLSQQLLTLKTDIPLGFNLRDIRLESEPQQVTE